MDDFVILHHQKSVLERWRVLIGRFLKKYLSLQLHPQKQIIREICKGTNFLGFRIFPYHKLLRKSNARSIQRNVTNMVEWHRNGMLPYDDLFAFLDGWIAYARHADTRKLRKNITVTLTNNFPRHISSIEIDRRLKIYRKKQR